MLDLRRVRLLTELARRGTIAEVARVAGYTPSAVSQSLARLEHEVGVPLLERDGRRVRLTPAAEGLVVRAERILAELDVAEAELAAEHEAVRGTVRAGAFPSAAAGLLLPAVLDLQDRHPDLACHVHEHEPEAGIALLRSGDLDLLVSERNDHVVPPPSGGLDAHPLLTEPLLLVTPEGPEETTTPTPLSSLQEASWIGGPVGSQYDAAIGRACRSVGFAARIVHRADEASLVQSLVASGMGVALLPALACTPFPGVRYGPVQPSPPRRHVAALVRRGAARRPALAAMLAALGRRAAEASSALERVGSA